MAEDLTEFLHEAGLKVRYMHSDVETLERIEIIRDLRLGVFDVLIGINLLREGLDIRSEEHTSELQSLMRISYAVFCLKKKSKHIICTKLLPPTSIDIYLT